jgi:hypothetical protein
MKQSDNKDAFFKKYGFTRHTEMPHPIYKDIMTFEGLEAEYVGRLEIELDHYKRALSDALMNNERLMTREYYRLKDEIEKLKTKND